MTYGRIFNRLRRRRHKQRQRSIRDFEEFCSNQYARLSIQFIRADQKRLEDRWSDGQWIGRSGLELQEERK